MRTTDLAHAAEALDGQRIQLGARERSRLLGLPATMAPLIPGADLDASFRFFPRVFQVLSMAFGAAWAQHAIERRSLVKEHEMSDSATGRPETKALAQETLDRQAPVVDVDRKGPEAQVLKRIQAKQAGKLSSGFGIRACIIV